MSEPLGHVVIRRVADGYRENPGSWCKYTGSLYKVSKNGSAEEVAKALCDPEKQGCIRTMIRCQSKLVAGKEWRRVARQAEKILCRHHGLWLGRFSIEIFNDERCKSAFEALEFVRAPLTQPRTVAKNTRIERTLENA